MGKNIRNTDWDAVTCIPGSGLLLSILADSSNSAASVAAFALPMPGTACICSAGIVASALSEFPAVASSSLETSTALLCFVPEFIIIASNSESLSEAAPDTLIFSLGLSSIFQLLIPIYKKNFPSNFGKFFQNRLP